jgi:hypothetical protein
MPRELPIPGPALSDPKAVEIARVWAAHKGEHVSLNVSLWEDPGSWGLIPDS